MSRFVNYYQLLNVSPKANQEEIKRAYLEKTKVTHPDKNHSPDANEKMSELNVAYEILGHPDRRKDYDRQFSLLQARPAPIFSQNDEASLRAQSYINEILREINEEHQKALKAQQKRQEKLRRQMKRQESVVNWFEHLEWSLRTVFEHMGELDKSITGCLLVLFALCSGSLCILLPLLIFQWGSK